MSKQTAAAALGFGRVSLLFWLFRGRTNFSTITYYTCVSNIHVRSSLFNEFAGLHIGYDTVDPYIVYQSYPVMYRQTVAVPHLDIAVPRHV